MMYMASFPIMQALLIIGCLMQCMGNFVKLLLPMVAVAVKMLMPDDE